MMGVNEVRLMGRVTRDPELKKTAGGKSVLEFRLAVNGRSQVAGERGLPTYTMVRTWEDLAEQCARVLVHGYPVYVEGALRNDEWTTPKGEPRSKLYVKATAIQFLGNLMGERKEAVEA